MTPTQTTLIPIHSINRDGGVRHILMWISGGALALLALEAARQRPLSRETEELVQYAGYALLVLAAIWLFTRDLENLAVFMSGQTIR